MSRSTASIQKKVFDDYIDSLVYSLQPTIRYACKVIIPNEFIHLNISEYWYACPISFEILMFLFGDGKHE